MAIWWNQHVQKMGEKWELVVVKELKMTGAARY